MNINIFYTIQKYCFVHTFDKKLGVFKQLPNMQKYLDKNRKRDKIFALCEQIKKYKKLSKDIDDLLTELNNMRRNINIWNTDNFIPSTYINYCNKVKKLKKIRDEYYNMKFYSYCDHKYLKLQELEYVIISPYEVLEEILKIMEGKDFVYYVIQDDKIFTIYK